MAVLHEKFVNIILPLLQFFVNYCITVAVTKLLENTLIKGLNVAKFCVLASSKSQRKGIRVVTNIAFHHIKSKKNRFYCHISSQSGNQCSNTKQNSYSK